MGKISSILILFLFIINVAPQLFSPASSLSHAKGALSTQKADNAYSVIAFLNQIMEEPQAEEKPEKNDKSSKLNIMPSSEDFCHPSNMYVRTPVRFYFISAFAKLEEKMYAHPCFNIISPPPEIA